jgi:hypothetical protein
LEESDVLQRELKAAIASADPSSLDAITFRIGTRVLEEGAFPEEYFRRILVTLQGESFLRLDGSWKLIRVFEENWKELSASQRTDLLGALEKSYASFHDWMACFVISGILGELYNDERAFDVLCRLRDGVKEMPRSFVPHGFEHMASSSSNQDLAQRALAELTKMQEDESEVVVKEVNESFSRLRTREAKKKWNPR